MNDKILELMKVRGTSDEIAAHINAFAETNGPKAIKQLERVIRQQRQYNQIMDIIQNDGGHDPRRQTKIHIRESTVPIRSYDEELQTIIDAQEKEPQLCCIDRCLWVYIDPNQDKSPDQKTDDFRAILEKADHAALSWLKEHFDGKVSFAPTLLEENLNCPESIPLFLRGLNPETIRDIFFDGLMNSVYLFLDLRALGEIFSEYGAQLIWSGFKEGRAEQAKPKEQRLLTIGERIPKIQFGKEQIVGLSKLYRVFFDGIIPNSIAAQYVEMLKMGSE